MRQGKVGLKGLVNFAGALAFLFGMMIAGLAVAVLLFKGAQLAGADEDLLRWLSVPIAVAALVACGLSGKYAARFLQKVL